MKGDEARIREEGAGLILATAVSDWEWLDAIAGKFSDDFFAAAREQPDLPPRPKLGGVFE